MSELAEDKWVRIMADFCADGIWDKDGCGCDVSELPVPVALQERLLKWQHWYDRDCKDYRPESPHDKPFDRAAFTAEGLAIAKAVKAELPDWTVVYFDEAKAHPLLGQGFDSVVNSDRSSFEYEIAEAVNRC